MPPPDLPSHNEHGATWGQGKDPTNQRGGGGGGGGPSGHLSARAEQRRKHHHRAGDPHSHNKSHKYTNVLKSEQFDVEFVLMDFSETFSFKGQTSFVFQFSEIRELNRI